MKKINLLFLLFAFVLVFVLGFSLSQTTAWKPKPKAANATRVLVVTGGHDHDADFYTVFADDNINAVVRRSRSEAGCLSHAVHQDTENPLRLVFVEEWSDRAALLAHFAVPESRAFAQTARTLAAEPPVLKIYDATPILFG